MTHFHAVVNERGPYSNLYLTGLSLSFQLEKNVMFNTFTVVAIVFNLVMQEQSAQITFIFHISSLKKGLTSFNPYSVEVVLACSQWLGLAAPTETECLSIYLC